MNSCPTTVVLGALAAFAFVAISPALIASEAAAEKESAAPPPPPPVTFVIAKNVILHEGKIVTWEEVERILHDSAATTKIHPQFYSTNGGLAREEELRERRWQLYGKLHDAGKIDGMSIGSLSPRAGERLDRIVTRDDLAPDMSRRLQGRVLGVDGKLVGGAEVFLLPDEHVNGVYLRDGFNRNPLEEHLTRTGDDGRFQIHTDEDEALLVAAHPSGFALMRLEEFKNKGDLELKPWARVSGDRPVTGADAEQTVNVSCYPVPGISFHIYETEITADGTFEQKFVPPGVVTVSRSLSLGGGGSMSFPVEQVTLAPGETHRVVLGPIPDADRKRVKEAQERP